METLDGYILNVFRTSNPSLTKDDFNREDVWVCDLLNQDIELAKEFIKHKLENCNSKFEKLQFLYDSRSCYRGTIQSLDNELEPEFNKEFSNYVGVSKKELKSRRGRYKQALDMTENAINYYLDCSKLECPDGEKCFKIRDKKGSKVDLIRILNAIYELKFIELKNGQIPTKEQFMKKVGNFFGADFSRYETDLSQALNNTSKDANTKIFESMKNIMEKSHYLEKESHS